jgi:hypothetical protein
MLAGSEEELEARWIEMATDTAVRQRLSEGALRHGSQFGWDEVTAKFEDIAAEVVASAPVR